MVTSHFVLIFFWQMNDDYDIHHTEYMMNSKTFAQVNAKNVLNVGSMTLCVPQKLELDVHRLQVDTEGFAFFNLTPKIPLHFEPKNSR